MTVAEPALNALWLSEALAVPAWNYFHEIFSILDHARLVLVFLEFLVSVNRVMGNYRDQKGLEQVAIRYRSVAARLYGDSRAVAAAFGDRLKRARAAELRQVLLDKEDVVGRALWDVVDEEWMRVYSEELMEGWREGLDGVLITGLDTNVR